MPVYTPHRVYDKARKQWDRCRDAFGGTDAVKDKQTEYLPLLEGQTGPNASSYVGYLNRALFYPAIARTVAGLSGLVFGKPPTVTGVSKLLQPEFDDVTLTGVSLGAFGVILCQEALITGRVGTLIDMPEQQVPGTRPYWAPYSAENIVNWRVERIAGQQVLTLVVLAEEKEVIDPLDFFAPKVARQYRVLQLQGGMYTVTVWAENPEKKGDFVAGTTRVPLRRGMPLNFIPFVFLGPTGIDPDPDHPPLLDLVDVNLSHYRTSADQEHGAHFTALPTPYVTGHTVPSGEQLAIGSGTAWVLPNANAKAGMVEFSGAGLESLAKLKEEKRLLMVTLGARMLETQKLGAEAAATVALRHAGERSALSVLADAVGQALTIGIQWHLFWDGVEETVADTALMKVNPDIMDQLTAVDIAALVATWQAGGISHKTLYFNLEWGEWTRPGVSFEDELKDIEAETPEPVLALPPGVVPQPGGPNPTPPKPGVPVPAPPPPQPGPKPPVPPKKP